MKKTEKDIAQAKKDLEKLTAQAKDAAIKETEYLLFPPFLFITKGTIRYIWNYCI